MNRDYKSEASYYRMKAKEIEMFLSPLSKQDELLVKLYRATANDFDKYAKQNEELAMKLDKRKNRRIQWLLQVVLTVLTFIPTYLFFILKAILVPNGFWQILFTYGLGLYFLGTAQLICIIIALGITVAVIWD